MSYYGMGDYYRGDYYRGDPGVFGFIGKAIGKVAGVASKLLPGPLGTIAGGVSRVFSTGAGRAPQLPVLRQIPAPVPYSYPQGVGTVMVPVPGIGGTLQRALPGGASGYEAGACPRGYRPNKSSYFLRDGSFVERGSKCVRVRRLNVTNVKALRKGIRRAAGFAKIARRVITISKRFKKPRRRR